jgi:hypothetical protein
VAPQNRPTGVLGSACYRRVTSFINLRRDLPTGSRDLPTGSSDGIFRRDLPTGISGSSDGISGSSDGISGSSDGNLGIFRRESRDLPTGISGSSDGIAGSSDGISGSSDGISGSSDGISGSSDGIRSGTRYTQQGGGTEQLTHDRSYSKMIIVSNNIYGTSFQQSMTRVAAIFLCFWT